VMFTPDERRAVWIAAMKFGFEEFAQAINTTPERLRAVLKGKVDIEVEMKVRRNWNLVKELLYGGVRK